MINVGQIIITAELADDGDMIISYSSEGDLPVVTQLGMLELTKDTILRPEGGDDDAT